MSRANPPKTPRDKSNRVTKFLIARLVTKADRTQEYFRCPCTCEKPK